MSKKEELVTPDPEEEERETIEISADEVGELGGDLLESIIGEAEIEETPFNEELADELAAAGELEVKQEPEAEEEEIVALSEDGAAVEHIEAATLETIGAENVIEAEEELSEEEEEELVAGLMGKTARPSDPANLGSERAGSPKNRPGARQRGGPKHELAKDENASVRVKRIQQDNA